MYGLIRANSATIFCAKNQVQFAQNAGSCCLRQAKWCEIHSRGLAPMSFCWNFLFPTQSTFAWTETLSKLNSYQKPEHHHYQLHHQHHRHHHHNHHQRHHQHHQRHHHHHHQKIHSRPVNNVKRYPTNYQCVRGSIENFCLWVFFTEVCRLLNKYLFPIFTIMWFRPLNLILHFYFC